MVLSIILTFLGNHWPEPSPVHRRPMWFDRDPIVDYIFVEETVVKTNKEIAKDKIVKEQNNYNIL